MAGVVSRDQVDRNYEAFKAALPYLMAQHADKYALIKDEQIKGTYSTLEDAYTAASQFLPDNEFSIQKITDSPVDLGFFSHAMPIR